MVDLPEEIEPIVAEQGWSDETLLELALRFIEDSDNLETFHECLVRAAEAV